MIVEADVSEFDVIHMHNYLFKQRYFLFCLRLGTYVLGSRFMPVIMGKTNHGFMTYLRMYCLEASRVIA
jgi:hypothetical protein